MLSVDCVIGELDGNGFNQRDLIYISAKLTQLVGIREEVRDSLTMVYEEDEVDDLLGTLLPPGDQQRRLSELLIDTLTKKQREVYLSYVVDRKSMGTIAKELEISKGTVQVCLDRSIAKIKLAEIKLKGNLSPAVHQKYLDCSPKLSEAERRYYSMHFVDGESQSEVGRKYDVSQTTVNIAIARAIRKLNID